MNLPSIIIPVHDAFEVLRTCLASLDRTVPEARVVVIDDASRDSRVITLLDDWCHSSKHRTLLRLDDNQGFVRAVNAGMAAVSEDVVLLNTDTVVTTGWLEALGRCLASDPTIATATPWTNNGEIVSFPALCVAAPVPKDPERLARAARASRKSEGYVDLPTAVGFCMAISRTALDRVGMFDAETFGRGYGEENDFCMRVIDAGLRNVLCDDAYVAHLGGASFGPLGLKPDEDSMRRLLHKHPGYLQQVQAWIESDPLAARRDAMARQMSGA